MTSPDQPSLWRARVALAVTLLIWSSFLVVTRVAMTGYLTEIEVGLIRFGTGAILFLPVLLRHGVVPRGAGWMEIVLIPAFGGIGFILFLSAGLRHAPVADSGVFAPSMLPLYVALLSLVFLGERFDRLRIVGFALIFGGALAVGGSSLLSGDAGAWRGHLLFTAASMSWAVYTILFRRSGLGPAEGAALLCVWSGLFFAVAALIKGVSFDGVPLEALLLQILFQGVLSGFVATFTYFQAIAAFGASRTAAYAALVPVLAALGGWVFLGEAIGPGKALGILVVVAGVVLASGQVSARRTRG
ncbi:MAG: DMT family transporter [Pseudomonadota bacterium]